IVCAASTKDEWTWTGTLGELEAVEPPEGQAGVLVIGEVVGVREQIFRLKAEATRDVASAFRRKEG
ncbi:MAG: hypothetical protein AB7P99_11095, partial [Vicinamibacterales bacterium]